MAEIKVVSSCLVGTNIASSMSTLELTSWDLRFLSRNYIQRGLIFHKPEQIDENLIHGLKTSLSRTLDFFPPLAGRLTTTAHGGDMSRFFVDCNNEGAEFRHAAAVAVSISDILEAKYTPEVVYSLFPPKGGFNIEGLSTPLLAVQVTELADGVFIGCSGNHAVVDGNSFWHFINSWSEISRGSETISKLPVYERWFPSNARDEDRLVHVPSIEQDLEFTAPSLTSPQKVFHFSKDSVVKLKAKANSEASSDKISSLQAVVAHLWRSIIRCRWHLTYQSEGENEEEARLIIPVGARSRMASLPEGYFGNAVHFDMVAMGVGELVEKGLGCAAVKINELVSRQTIEALIRGAEKKVEYLRAGGLIRSGRLPLIVAGSPRYDVYGNDFGWGKPIAVRSGKSQKRDGLVFLFPAAEAGGIDVEVCLPQETLEAMECDAHFVEL